jgi:hypothetical protein
VHIYTSRLYTSRLYRRLGDHPCQRSRLLTVFRDGNADRQ